MKHENKTESQLVQEVDTLQVRLAELDQAEKEWKQAEQTLNTSDQAIRDLYEITSAPNIPFEKRLQNLLEMGAKRFGLPASLLTRWKHENLEILAAYPTQGKFGKGSLVQKDLSFCGTTLTAHGPLSFEHAGESEWQHHPAYKALGLEAYLGTQIQVGGKVFGTLCFVSHTPYEGKFTETDKDFLQLMARWIGGELARTFAEEALREREALFHTLAKVSPVGIFQTDADNNCLYVNEKWCEIAGLTSEEAQGQGWAQALHPEDRQRVYSVWQEATRNKRQFQTTYRFQRPDGTSTWLLGQAEAIRNPTGEVTGYVGTITDITEQKRAKEILQAMVEGTASVTGTNFFRALVENLAMVFQVPTAFIAECPDATNTTLRTLAFWKDKTHSENIEYALRGTPCENALAGKWTHYPENVQALYPLDVLVQLQANGYLAIPLYDSFRKILGVLVMVDTKPLNLDAHKESVLKIFAARAGAELERLQAEHTLRNQEQQLQKALDERTGISRDLHDHILQSLFAVGLMLAAVKKPMREQKVEEGVGYLEQAVSQLNEAMREIRLFIENLTTKNLGEEEEEEFTDSLIALVESFNIPGALPFEVKMDFFAVQSFPKEYRSPLLSIAREAISNSLRHAKATKGKITLDLDERGWRFVVQDNGVGFTVQPQPSQGLGLSNMQARAKDIGADLHIDSSPRHGVCVTMTIPNEKYEYSNN